MSNSPETENKAEIAVPQRMREEIFIGTFSHKLDPKKRVTIPATWRLFVGDGAALFVIPVGDDPCLQVFTEKEMIARLTHVGRHELSDKKARMYSRALASRSELISLDCQGRIRVKDGLLSQAGIGEHVELVGQFHYFEMWNPKTFKASAKDDNVSTFDALKNYGL